MTTRERPPDKGPLLRQALALHPRDGEPDNRVWARFAHLGVSAIACYHAARFDYVELSVRQTLALELHIADPCDLPPSQGEIAKPRDRSTDWKINAGLRLDRARIGKLKRAATLAGTSPSGLLEQWIDERTT